MPEFVTQRVTLDITVRVGQATLPEKWSFWAMLDVDGWRDHVKVVNVETVPCDPDTITFMTSADDE